MGRSIPMLNALLACAMVERCALAEAAVKCGANKEQLADAVKYRCSVATGGPDGKGKWFDYEESIYEAFKRLEAAN